MYKVYIVFSGNEWFYDDDDTKWKTIVYIGKRGGIFRTFNGLFIIFF